MGERASYRQAKKDRLPPSVRNDPGPDYTCRVEDRDCGKKVRLAPCGTCYFVGTRRFSSSNQFNTMTISSRGGRPTGFITTKRPSGATSYCLSKIGRA